MIRPSRKRMTLAGLKRHIDRRFATKAYLRRFATKEDLRQFATKKDLRRFATKKNLQRFATKDDLTALETRMDARFGQMMRRFDSLDAKIDAGLKFAGDGIRHHRMLLDEHEVDFGISRRWHSDETLAEEDHHARQET